MHPRPTRLLIWTALLTLVMAVLPGTATAAVGGEGGGGKGWGGARVVAEEKVGPRLLDLTVSSPALGRTAKVRLLTPDGWEERRKHQRWPVLFLLHGCCDTYDSWTRETDVASLPQLRNTLVVMPEGDRPGGTATGGTTARADRRRGRPSTCASCARCWSTAMVPAIAG